LLATQFEAIAAHEMYPGFDEPDLKATFNVTVAHQPDIVALSNMPVVDTLSR
jgi:aminopeptidase N